MSLCKQRLVFVFRCYFRAASVEELDSLQCSANPKSPICVGTEGIRQLWIRSLMQGRLFHTQPEIQVKFQSSLL